MRNRYAGSCFRCGKTVGVGEGHFERCGNHWKVQHVECVFENRRDKLISEKKNHNKD